MNTKGILILAAGRGTRLSTSKPKALTSFFGQSFLSRIISNLPSQDVYIVISPKDREIFEQECPTNIKFIEQEQPLGTADAVLVSLPKLQAYKSIIVLCADMPLVPKSLIEMLYQAPSSNRMIGFEPDDPTQYGLVECQDQQAITILEPSMHHKTSSRIANSGIIEITQMTLPEIKAIAPCEKTGEYYLTQIIQPHRPFDLILSQESAFIFTGVNTPKQLIWLKKQYLSSLQTQIMQVASVEHPQTLMLEKMPTIGHNVTIGANVQLYGNNTIGDGCIIESGCILNHVTLGKNVHLKPYSIVDYSHIQDSAQIGPFCHIQQQSNIGRSAIIGNFVEVTRSVIGECTKAKHLAYLGDARIAEHVNIGAGVITCNYHPIKKTKYLTEIAAYSQIGANTCLIAPIQIMHHTITGAGTVLSRNTHPYQLVYLERRIVSKQIMLQQEK
ncbi:NTP transferase domain-containing protein [Gammaproteobacteria bacterium]|nr:NTP transferase domain-containing protein [Gammaproteobacteria bacterium]